MKINHSLYRLRELGQTLNSLFSKSKISLSKKRILKPLNCFLSWPVMPKRHLLYKLGHETSPHIDVKAIKQFLISYKDRVHHHSLMSSSYYGWSSVNAHQEAAIKKMIALLEKTMSDMEMVEVTLGSRKKG